MKFVVTCIAELFFCGEGGEKLVGFVLFFCVLFS